MSDVVPDTAKDIPTEANTTNAKDAIDKAVAFGANFGVGRQLNESDFEDKGVLPPDTDKPPASKFWSQVVAQMYDETPKQNQTPVTKRSLRDSGFQPTQTNIWSKGDLHVQLNDINGQWTLLSTNTVVNFIEDIEQC